MRRRNNSGYRVDIVYINPIINKLHEHMTERVGFEPTVELPPHRFSRPAYSTALAPLQIRPPLAVGPILLPFLWRFRVQVYFTPDRKTDGLPRKRRRSQQGCTHPSFTGRSANLTIFPYRRADCGSLIIYANFECLRVVIDPRRPLLPHSRRRDAIPVRSGCCSAPACGRSLCRN